MAKKQFEWTEELLNQYTAPYGLDKLDRDSKITIANMQISTFLRTFRLKSDILCVAESYALTAIYSQNYIIMRQLQEQKEELIKNNELNQKLQEQNQQIIEQNNILVNQNEENNQLNKKIVEQNDQIIALLTKISEK